jgi:hypothetical protein
MMTSWARISVGAMWARDMRAFGFVRGPLLGVGEAGVIGWRLHVRNVGVLELPEEGVP